MVVVAVNWQPGREITRVDVLSTPALAHYVIGWPAPGESGVIALDDDGHRIGAAWVRFLTADDPGYGFVAPDVPEISLAVVEDSRGHGIGRALLRAALDVVRATNVARVSLSVERANRAAAFYATEGFVTVESLGDADTMVLRL